MGSPELGPALRRVTALVSEADRVDRRSLYTSTRGLPQTRQAVARFVERTFAASVDPDDNVLMTVGGTEAHIDKALGRVEKALTAG